MKRTFILSLAVLFTAALVFSSCQTSRVWETKKKNKDKDREYQEDRADRDRDYRDYREPDYRPAPPPPAPTRYNRSTSLIISPTPGFVMKPATGGRFYHRSPSGLLYWKGYDNRFYLDRSYIDNISYSRGEYEEWRRYSRQSR